MQAESREHLRELLAVASGGVVFTTVQKFGTKKGERFPQLTDRRNVVVMADEAHRSQYELIDGFARNLRDGLPNASFIGFTGTPIEFDDKSTPAVFGDYVHTYPIAQAVEDGATVIYYEARLAMIQLPDDRKLEVDEDFEEVTEGEEESTKGRLKSRLPPPPTAEEPISPKVAPVASPEPVDPADFAATSVHQRAYDLSWNHRSMS